MTDKWIPVYEFCVKELSKEKVLPVIRLNHWADIFASGTIVPKKEIPKVIKALRSSKAKLNHVIGAEKVALSIQRAIEKLEQQMKERKR